MSQYSLIPSKYTTKRQQYQFLFSPRRFHSEGINKRNSDSQNIQYCYKYNNPKNTQHKNSIILFLLVGTKNQKLQLSAIPKYRFKIYNGYIAHQTSLKCYFEFRRRCSPELQFSFHIVYK